MTVLEPKLDYFIKRFPYNLQIVHLAENDVIVELLKSKLRQGSLHLL
jgi:hypothetical protein